MSGRFRRQDVDDPSPRHPSTGGDLQGWAWRQVWARRREWSPFVPVKQFALAAAWRKNFSLCSL